MIDYVVLRDVGSQTASLSTGPLNGQKGKYGFMNLGSVKKTASGK